MKLGQFCAKAAEERGLIVRPLGGNRIALCPPLIIQNDHVDEIIDKLSGALADTLDMAAAQKLI